MRTLSCRRCKSHADTSARARPVSRSQWRRMVHDKDESILLFTLHMNENAGYEGEARQVCRAPLSKFPMENTERAEID